MVKDVKKFIQKNERQTNKILKRMFGLKSIVQAIKESEDLKLELEKKFNKEIDLIDWSVIKLNYNFRNAYVYAKYLTLEAIINQYLENKKLYPYTNDLQEVINEY